MAIFELTGWDTKLRIPPFVVVKVRAKNLDEAKKKIYEKLKTMESLPNKEIKYGIYVADEYGGHALLEWLKKEELTKKLKEVV